MLNALAPLNKVKRIAVVIQMGGGKIPISSQAYIHCFGCIVVGPGDIVPSLRTHPGGARSSEDQYLAVVCCGYVLLHQIVIP